MTLDQTDANHLQDITLSRALWFDAPGRCAIRQAELPAIGSGDVLVHALYSGISRGTEATVFNGLVPDSESERMRAPHMEGQFSFPVKYGYCAVGMVADGEAELLGKPVFCLFPHQDKFIVKATDVTKLPDALPPHRAILAANIETALNIVWDAQVGPGDRVAVFGAGVVGTLVAYLASNIVGTDVVLADPDLERASLAAALDIAFATPNGLDGEYDVLINASGASAALSQAIGLAGLESRIVEASWYGERQATLSLGGAFHSKRLSIISSQVGQVSPSRRARWSYRRRLEKALALLLDERLEALISGETGFADLVTDYPRILNATSTLCHRVRY